VDKKWGLTYFKLTPIFIFKLIYISPAEQQG